MDMRVIVSALIKRGDEYLFIRQNKPGGAYPGTLHIPGGGLEEGEDPDSAVRREVLEETGLQVTNLTRHDFDYDVVNYKGRPTQFVFLRYLCDWQSGVGAPGSDAAELVWLTKTGVKAAQHNPPSVRLLTGIGLLRRDAEKA